MKSNSRWLVGHVDAEFRRRDKVFPGALCDHHAGLLVEHGGNLGRRLGDRQVLCRLGVVTALEVKGHIAVLPQEGEELQQEVAEVLADAKPPCRNIRTEEKHHDIMTHNRAQEHDTVTELKMSVNQHVDRNIIKS